LTIYYGEEIGMVNVPIPAEEVRDPAEINEPGIGAGRDPERTPMQWDASPQAAFTTGQPWLPIAKHDVVNVETLEQQTGSLLHLYRALLALRRREPILVGGKMAFVKVDKKILRYQRIEGEDCLQILLNLGHEPEQVNVDQGRIVLSTYLDRVGEESRGELELRPAEAVIIRTSKA
jgi:alpha-glucosidase